MLYNDTCTKMLFVLRDECAYLCPYKLVSEEKFDNNTKKLFYKCQSKCPDDTPFSDSLGNASKCVSDCGGLCILDGACSSSCPNNTWEFAGNSKMCVCMPKSCDEHKPFLLETTNGTQCLEQCDRSLFVDPVTMQCVDYCQTRSFVEINGTRYCENESTLDYFTDDDSDSAQQFVYCPSDHKFVNRSAGTCVN